jgi:hypothetical protein
VPFEFFPSHRERRKYASEADCRATLVHCLAYDDGNGERTHLARDAPVAALERPGPIQLENRTDGCSLSSGGRDADGFAERTERGERLAAKAKREDGREVIEACKLGRMVLEC